MRAVFRWFWQMEAWVRRLFLLSGLIAILGAALVYTPTEYYITAPGAAIDTSRLVSVKGGDRHRGRLYMLVVNTQPANLFWYLYARVDDRAELQTRKEYLGSFETYAEYMEWNQGLMTESQRTAKAIALQVLGFGQGVRSNGVLVTGILADSPARGLLRAGDVIVAVDDQPVHQSAELLSIMRARQGGDRLKVVVRRDGEEQPLTVPTAAAKEPDRQGTALFGISIRDALEFDDDPVPVEIHSGAVFGPSAGLMFTLQIIDQLTPGGIAGGLVVSGTGTVEPDGRVGAIGGVQQKVFTAEAAGVDVMFVPRSNYADAAKVATRIQVVSVETVKDAIAWLQGHATEKAGTRVLGWIGASPSADSSGAVRCAFGGTPWCALAAGRCIARG